MDFRIISKQVFIIGILLLGGLLLGGCEENYKLFDTTPSFETGKPKIRFLNLHFIEKNLTLNIGDGKLVKQNLVHRELTAYEEAPDFLNEKTPFVVTDADGTVLLQDSLSVQEGNNYTFYISPAYNTIISDFQITGTATSRLMASLRTDKVGYGLIADPISASLADRATVRQVSFTPIIVAKPEFFFLESIDNLPYSINANEDDIYFIKDQTRQPDYAFGSSFINFGYQVTSPGSYHFRWGGRGVAATSITSNVQLERVMNLSSAQPYHFQAGKTYTILSNGTVGSSNDLVFPSNVRGPIALSPIPYEAFILDDLDASARTLVPVAFDRASRQVAIINFIDLNYMWKATNPATQLQLSIRGVVPTKGQLYFDDPRLINLPGNVCFETKQFGNQIIESLPVGFSRPALASSEANLKANGKYFAFHYIDQSSTAKIKVVEADTVVNYNSVIRINFANFSPDLEHLAVMNAETKQVLIPDVRFTELSNSAELTVDRSFIGSRVVEKVAKLLVIRPSTNEVLFEIDLTPTDVEDGITNLLLGGGQRNSGLIYTVIFSGKYNATTGPDQFQKTLFCLERADQPTNSGENIFDWRLSYGLFP